MSNVWKRLPEQDDRRGDETLVGRGIQQHRPLDNEYREECEQAVLPEQVACAVYEETRKSEKVERHETAPRPALPEAVSDALAFDESGATGRQTESEPEFT